MRSILFSMLILVVSQAMADKDRGGGGAVVCRDTAGRIISAELLDLYEARVVDGIELRDSAASHEEEFLRYLELRHEIFTGKKKKLTEKEREQNRLYLEQTIENYYVFLPVGERLSETGDFGSVPPLPRGCRIEQLAVFEDVNPRLLIDSEIWSALDGVSQAAVYCHESYYRRFRLSGETTSENARKIVGRAFAEHPVAHVNEGVPSSAQTCVAQGSNSGVTRFYSFADPMDPNTAIFQFEELFNRPTFGPVKTVVPGFFDEAKSQLDHTAVVLNSVFQPYFVRVIKNGGKPARLILLNAAGESLEEDRITDCRPARAR